MTQTAMHIYPKYLNQHACAYSNVPVQTVQIQNRHQSDICRSSSFSETWLVVRWICSAFRTSMVRYNFLIFTLFIEIQGNGYTFKLSKLFGASYEKGSTLKGKNLPPFRRGLFCRKENRKSQIFSLVIKMENLPSVCCTLKITCNSMSISRILRGKV